MKTLGIVLSLALLTILLPGNALAQGDNSVYFTTFYTNANIAGVPDPTLRLVNDGERGTLWASIYVFDDSQEMQECCSCSVSADGLLSESLNKELLTNSITGKVNHVGTINVISSSTPGPTSNTPAPGLRGQISWDIATNSPVDVPVSNAVDLFLQMEEHPLADSNLVSAEQTALQESCSFGITLGSGAGTCTCTPEGRDF
jgi:hypothetical protein